MAGKIISTIDTNNSLSAGGDKNFELKKPENQDTPIQYIDQSKVCSTRNIVPNKREVKMKDVKKFVGKLKNTNKQKPIEEKKRSKKESKTEEEKQG